MIPAWQTVLIMGAIIAAGLAGWYCGYAAGTLDTIIAMRDRQSIRTRPDGEE